MRTTPPPPAARSSRPRVGPYLSSDSLSSPRNGERPTALASSPRRHVRRFGPRLRSRVRCTGGSIKRLYTKSWRSSAASPHRISVARDPRSPSVGRARLRGPRRPSRWYLGTTATRSCSEGACGQTFYATQTGVWSGLLESMTSRPRDAAQVRRAAEAVDIGASAPTAAWSTVAEAFRSVSPAQERRAEARAKSSDRFVGLEAARYSPCEPAQPDRLVVSALHRARRSADEGSACRGASARPRSVRRDQVDVDVDRDRLDPKTFDPLSSSPRARPRRLCSRPRRSVARVEPALELRWWVNKAVSPPRRPRRRKR